MTKRQLKKIKGMNDATKFALQSGHKPPVYVNLAKPNELPRYAKVAKGVPYVNPNNF